MREVFLVFALSIAGVLWRIADAALVARWQSGTPLQWFQRWYVYLATMALSYGFTMAAVSVTTRYVAQAYYIPSGAMIPTLAINDRILVDKLTYRWKNPERDDVVVFRAPPQASPEEKEFTKRVIGLPGDTVAVVPDTLLVDGKPAVVVNDDPGSTTDTFRPALQHGLRWLEREQSPRVRENMLREGGEPRVVATPSGQAEIREGQLWVNGQRLAYVGGADGVKISPDLTPFGAAPGVQGTVYDLPQSDRPALIVLKGKQLTLRPGYVSINGQPLKEPYARQTPRYEMPPLKVPAGYDFVLGDNRNDSNDSHAWGPLARNRISGVARMIWFSPDPARVGRPLR